MAEAAEPVTAPSRSRKPGR